MAIRLLSTKEWKEADKKLYTNCAVFKISPEALSVVKRFDEKIKEFWPMWKTVQKKQKNYYDVLVNKAGTPLNTHWAQGVYSAIFPDKVDRGFSVGILNAPLFPSITEIKQKSNPIITLYDGKTLEEWTEWSSKQFHKYINTLEEAATSGKLMVINLPTNKGWAYILWPLMLSTITVIVKENEAVQYKLPLQTKIITGLKQLLNDVISYDITAINSSSAEKTKPLTAVSDVSLDDLESIFGKETPRSIFASTLHEQMRHWQNVWSLEQTNVAGVVETWSLGANLNFNVPPPNTVNIGSIFWGIVSEENFDPFIEGELIPGTMTENLWKGRVGQDKIATISLGSLPPNRGSIVDRFLDTVAFDNKSFIWKGQLNIRYGGNPENALSEYIRANSQLLLQSWHTSAHNEWMETWGFISNKHTPWIPPHLAKNTAYDKFQHEPKTLLRDLTLMLKSNILQWGVAHIIAIASGVRVTSLSKLNGFMALNFGIGLPKESNKLKFAIAPWFCTVELKNFRKIIEQPVKINENIFMDRERKTKQLTGRSA